MPYRKTDYPGIIVSRNRHGKYYARWRDPDTLEFKTEAFSVHGFTTKAQAAGWLEKKSKEIREGKRLASTRGRHANVGEIWGEIQKAYLAHFSSDHGKPAADRLERDWLKRWREFLSRRAIREGRDLTAYNLAQFRAGLASDEIRPSTRNRTLGSVKAYLIWGIDSDYLRINGDDIRKHLKPFSLSRYEPRVLKTSELERLLDALVEHDTDRYFASRDNKNAYSKPEQGPSGAAKYQALAPFTLLALLTGARPGEVLTLKWTDVDFEAKEISVWGSKTRRQRVVPMHDSPALEELLAALKLLAGVNVHVCGDWENGKPIEVHDRQWKRLMELAGLEGTPQKVLRSTCVAHVASASPESEYLLEARFGHGANVSKAHYRRPLHGLANRGNSVEEWLGIASKLKESMHALGYHSKVSSPAASKKKPLSA